MMKLEELLATIGLVLFALALWVIPLRAQGAEVQLDRDGCAAVAVWSGDLVLMRETGSDKEKVKTALAQLAADNPSVKDVMAVLLLVFDEIWERGVGREMTAQAMYQICVAKRGRFGVGA